jgi:high-affinity K+ transport system ATPase subunit B
MSKNNSINVIRTDHATYISEEDLRNRDIVLIQAGDLVPVDIKLIETRNLELDEYHLTGEIKPVACATTGLMISLPSGLRVWEYLLRRKVHLLLGESRKSSSMI